MLISESKSKSKSKLISKFIDFDANNWYPHKKIQTKTIKIYIKMTLKEH